MIIHVITSTVSNYCDDPDCSVLAAFKDFNEAAKFIKQAMEEELVESYCGDRHCIELYSDTICTLYSPNQSHIFEMHEAELS